MQTKGDETPVLMVFKFLMSMLIFLLLLLSLLLLKILILFLVFHIFLTPKCMAEVQFVMVCWITKELP
jgi:hypothetical protein